MKRIGPAFTRRLRIWAARRHGSDRLPHTVQRRRIYILPTRFGLTVAALLVAMLIAGLNYGSNLALGFAFLMASLVIVAMHHCHRNLLQVSVDAQPTADGFEGEHAALDFRIDNPSNFDRYDLEIHCRDATPRIFGVPRRSTVTHQSRLPCASRGMLEIPQWELRTRYPFGWFRAWTYVQAPLTVFVAPAPRGDQNLVASGDSGADQLSRLQTGDDEFAGLRAYRPGDALKHMAWKVIARGQDAAVRQYSTPAARADWLDYAALPGLDASTRLRQLCRWIVDRDARGQPYGLRLPGLSIAPTTGLAHRRLCLRALAAFK